MEADASDLSSSNLLRGAAVGCLATLVMSAFMLATRRLGLMGTLPPERITARFLNSLGWRRSSGQQDQLAAVAHIGFGAAGGALYALGRPLLPKRLPVVSGMLFGTAVWAFSYLGWVPALGILPPAHRDRPGRPQSMVAAHWIYGAVLGALVR